MWETYPEREGWVMWKSPGMYLLTTYPFLNTLLQSFTMFEWLQCEGEVLLVEMWSVFMQTVPRLCMWLRQISHIINWERQTSRVTVCVFTWKTDSRQQWIRVKFCLLFPQLRWIGLPSNIDFSNLLDPFSLCATLPSQSISLYSGLLSVRWDDDNNGT